jgi:hypothetical protein
MRAERGVRAAGKAVSKRAYRFEMTETRCHKLHRCEASDDGADSPACSIFRKGRAHMCPARGTHTKAPAVDVMGNCDRRGQTSLIVVAHIASAANTSNEIAADAPTPWTFYI